MQSWTNLPQLTQAEVSDIDNTIEFDQNKRRVDISDMPTLTVDEVYTEEQLDVAVPTSDSLDIQSEETFPFPIQPLSDAATTTATGAKPLAPLTVSQVMQRD